MTKWEELENGKFAQILHGSVQCGDGYAHLLEKGDVGSAKGMLIWGQQQAEEAYLSGESNPRG